MLWFVGLGISGTQSIPIEVVKIIQKADFVYLESFTSPIYKQQEEEIKNMVNGSFKIAKRWLVEDGQEILKASKSSTVVLLSYGDPYVATTHIELRTRAKLEKIETNTIHSASAITSMIGEAGLQFYKVGRIVTIMNEKKSIITPYTAIFKNLIQGLHSVILLEYNQDENYFLDPKDAISSLLDVEKEQKRNVVNNDTFAIVASRIGFETQKITSGKFSNLLKVDFGELPHSIIITGKLHFTESDAINVLTECLDKPSDNSSRIKSTSIQMIEKYVPMVREALEEVKPFYNNAKEFQEILQNAELYINDAENFLKQGKDENAVLSIGYADGLVDALRMAKGIDPKM
uniref:Diphthine synthase (DPH5) n=2 Tax=environmental samples TaxID=651140 RepID=A0A075GY17_9ARCH|nr:diphthine synthase (DPH5) [uncultured marine thaumarchaeote KM3_05_G02]AIF06703.1 Diphthine synthase (DPH5) [uncultured marine thaumarchaeote KM3_195_B03]